MYDLRPTTIQRIRRLQTYTRRQITLYRMFFADFSVNSPPIFMKFVWTICESLGDYREIFIGE